MKTNKVIPSFMKLANITSIYKGKFSKLDMGNQRGIFGLTIFKKILHNLILNDLYDDIDKNMTDSNIGGRKKRMPADHLFVLYGIMDSVLNDKNKDPIDILVFDVEKAFDKLFLEECANDLLDVLPESNKDDKINLLYLSNESSSVSVNTPFGPTNRIEVNRIVEQGGSSGGIFCANSIDSLEKERQESNSNKYKYEETLDISLLSYMDDINNVSQCGIEAL